MKIDNCGSSHNVTFYSELFNKSGKAIRIEDCHTAPAHPQAGPSGTSDEDFKCPMNMYRSGGQCSVKTGVAPLSAESLLEGTDASACCARFLLARGSLFYFVLFSVLMMMMMTLMMTMNDAVIAIASHS